MSKKPLFVGRQLLITRPCCLCFNPLFHGPREVDKGGWLFVIDDSQNIRDTVGAEVWRVAGKRKCSVSVSAYSRCLGIDRDGSFHLLSAPKQATPNYCHQLRASAPVLVSCSACWTCTYLPWRCCYPRLRDRYGGFGRACAGLCGVPPVPKVLLLPSLVPSRYQPGACHPLLPPDSRLRPSAGQPIHRQKIFSSV